MRGMREKTCGNLKARRSKNRMAQINVRVDDAVKRGAEEVFDEIGLSMNAAVTVFLKACVREKRIPFELSADTARKKLPGGGYDLCPGITETTLKK